MFAVEVENMNKKLKDNLVLNNINLQIEAGTINAFYGPNGSGKTMLFRALSGLIKPDSGEIRIFGQTLGKEIEFPPSLGLMIENVGFWKEFTGFENLKMLADIKKIVTDDEIVHTLARVGLNPDDKRSYKKYSLGMKQRLAIAQAIMEKPDLLILDEPTNALDFDAVDEFKKIIREEKSRGATILLSSHRREDMLDLADDFYHMKEGGILEKTAEGIE